MKIMRISCGMANTMFQYAAYLQIKKMYPNEDVYVDTMWHEITKYPYELNKAFGIDISNYDFWEKAKKENRLDYEAEFDQYRIWEKYGYKSWVNMVDQIYEYVPGGSEIEYPQIYQKAGYEFDIELADGATFKELKYALDNKLIFPKNTRKCFKNFLQKVLGKYNSIFMYERAIRIPDKRKKLLSDILNLQKPDFTGYPPVERFKCEGDAYFCTFGNPNDVVGIENELKEIFTFVPFEEENNIQLAKEIEAVESVSIHTRVSAMDYGMSAALHRNYYKKAVNYIEKKLGTNVQYFIFSDRPEWVKENLECVGINEERKYVIVNNNSGEKSFRDMQLMSMCKHNICAQSTFSWWAGFLNNNDDKIWITPYETMPGTISF